MEVQGWWVETRGGTSPYVWMSKRKLLIDLIMDDNVRTKVGGVCGSKNTRL